MTGDEFKAQAAAVVDAHTRGQGIHVLDAATIFTSSSGGAALFLYRYQNIKSASAGTLHVTKSAAGRAQFQTTGFRDAQVTRWLDSPPSPAELAQLAPFAGFFMGVSDTDIAALFVRGVRSSFCKSRR